MAFTASLVITLDKMKFVNKYINWMASSALAIYLFTDNGVTRIPLDTWLLKEVLDGVQGYVYIFVVAISCLAIDKLRECLFGLIQRLVQKTNVRAIIKQ